MNRRGARGIIRAGRKRMLSRKADQDMLVVARTAGRLWLFQERSEGGRARGGKRRSRTRDRATDEMSTTASPRWRMTE